MSAAAQAALQPSFEVHAFRATDKAHYSLLYNPYNTKWIAWITSADATKQIEYSEHERSLDALVQLNDIYFQLEEAPLQ